MSKANCPLEIETQEELIFEEPLETIERLKREKSVFCDYAARFVSESFRIDMEEVEDSISCTVCLKVLNSVDIMQLYIEPENETECPTNRIMCHSKKECFRSIFSSPNSIYGGKRFYCSIFSKQSLQQRTVFFHDPPVDSNQIYVSINDSYWAEE